MKVLQFCPKPPLPSIDGGCLASFKLSLDILSCGGELDIFTLSTEKHPFDQSEFDKKFGDRINVSHTPIDTSFGAGNVIANFFRSKSLHEVRFFQTHAADELRSVIFENQYDLIVLDGLMTTFYLESIRSITDKPVIYRSHNIEYKILDENAAYEKNSVKKFVWSLLAKRIKKFEIDLWKKVDGVLSISHRNHTMVSNINKNQSTIWYPISADINITDKVSENSVYHLGSMEWEPNLKGVKWFLQKVWPLVIKANDKAILHLGGKSIGDTGLSAHSSVKVHNEVVDANQFIKDKKILVVPLFSGSGLRIKIIEAMSMGKAVVGTSTAFEGMANESKFKSFNDAESMAHEIITLLKDGDYYHQLSQKGIEEVEENYSSEVNQKRLKSYFEAFLKDA